MFIDVLNMLPLEVKREFSRVIKESAPTDTYGYLSVIIMQSDLRPCAECRASNHMVTNTFGCERQIVVLDVVGSSCTSYSPQGKCILLIHFA